MKSVVSTSIFVACARKKSFTLAGLIICMVLAAPAARAGGRCSLQTMTGTYAFYERGSSEIVDTSKAPFLLHWDAAIAPFINVGEITFKPDGTADGFYWIRVGSLNAGPDPIPVHGTVTEMNQDCTGKFRYVSNLPGGLSATIDERFIVFDEGREFRTIPTSIQNGLPTLAWIGTGHRISNGSAPVKFCGRQTASGTYLFSVENILEFSAPTPPGVADTLLLHINVSMTGDYTGTLYEKAGPVGDILLPVNGTISVNPDCSLTGTLLIPAIDGNIVYKGVYFNEGKDLYIMSILNPTVPFPSDQQVLLYSFGEGTRIEQ